MDATRLRALVEGALESQRLLDEAEKARAAADEAITRARERHQAEVGNLKAALDGAFVVFGDRVIRVGPAERGQRVHECPLVSVPVLAPPPPPLPEADADAPGPRKTELPTVKVVTAPLAGGRVPTLGKK